MNVYKSWDEIMEDVNYFPFWNIYNGFQFQRYAMYYISQEYKYIDQKYVRNKFKMMIKKYNEQLNFDFLDY